MMHCPNIFFLLFVLRSITLVKLDELRKKVLVVNMDISHIISHKITRGPRNLIVKDL